MFVVFQLQFAHISNREFPSLEIVQLATGQGLAGQPGGGCSFYRNVKCNVYDDVGSSRVGHVAVHPGYPRRFADLNILGHWTIAIKTL